MSFASLSRDSATVVLLLKYQRLSKYGKCDIELRFQHYPKYFKYIQNVITLLLFRDLHHLSINFI